MNARSLLATIFLLAAPAGAQQIIVGDVTSQPGSAFWVGVEIDPEGKSISTLQFDIGFDNSKLSAISPYCEIQAGLEKSFQYRRHPLGCSGSTCDRVRVVITVTDPEIHDRGAILSRTTVARCRLQVNTGTPAGVYALILSNFVAADAGGTQKPLVADQGSVTVNSPGPGPGPGCS